MTTAFQSADRDAYRHHVAPKGVLRLGLYRGSPSSYVEDRASGEPRGVGYLIGQCLAEQLELPFSPCIFDSNADVLSAMKAQDIDLMFTNATEARKQFISFAPVLLEVGKSILAPAASALHQLAELDERGYRIGFSKGSTTGTEFGKLFPLAEVVAVDDLVSAASLLQAGRLDGFATNKAILLKLAASMPDARLLPDDWGKEQYALGVPLAHDEARPLLTAFSHWLASSGKLEQYTEVSGFQGARSAHR
ncbi:transporter substrate-binding domain-containing protein [Bordetella genomosp. 8]|nr:transporter substrate-binding domain-containing protein [Bordetella genomosp. 8]